MRYTELFHLSDFAKKAGITCTHTAAMAWEAMEHNQSTEPEKKHGKPKFMNWRVMTGALKYNDYKEHSKTKTKDNSSYIPFLCA